MTSTTTSYGFIIMAEPFYGKCVNVADVIHVADMDEAYGTYAADDK